MFTPDDFEKFIDGIARLNGISREEAGKYAVRIGDTPLLDEEGLVVVRDAEGAVVRRVRVPIEED